MIANGLATLLPGKTFNQFIKQIGFVGIAAFIDEATESDPED